jgi:hypothetical protein
MTKKTIEENFEWIVTPTTEHMIILYLNSKILNVKTIGDFLTVNEISLNSMPDIFFNDIWGKIYVVKSDVYVYSSFYSFENVRDGNLTEFSLLKQIQDNLINTDFEKNPLKNRILELMRFVPHTKFILSSILNVRKLLNETGELQLAKRVEKRLRM